MSQPVEINGQGIQKILKDSFVIALRFKNLHTESPQCDLCQNIDNLVYSFYWHHAGLNVDVLFNFCQYQSYSAVNSQDFSNFDCELYYIVDYIVLLGKYYI